MFEVGKSYETMNGDKIVCEKHDKRNDSWLLTGVGVFGYIVAWCWGDGSLCECEEIGPIIKGPWIEKEKEQGGSDV